MYTGHEGWGVVGGGDTCVDWTNTASVGWFLSSSAVAMRPALAGASSTSSSLLQSGVNGFFMLNVDVDLLKVKGGSAADVGSVIGRLGPGW